MGESVGNLFRAKCVTLDSGGEPKATTFDALLEGWGTQGHTTWGHLEVIDRDGAADFLVDRFGFSAGGVEDAVHGYTRPGIEERREYLSFTMPALETTKGGFFYHTVGVYLSRSSLLTLSSSPCPRIVELMGNWEKDWEDLGRQPAQVMHALLDTLLDLYYPAVDLIHDHIEDLEVQLYTKDGLAPQTALGHRKDLLEMRKQVSAIRDVLNALTRHGAPIIPTDMIPDYSDLYNHSVRMIENIDLGRDILGTVMDAQLAITNNRLSQVMKTLTVISTLMMACSLVAGIYGMNFQHMPELAWRYGYPFAFFVMACLCGLITWLFYRKGYL